MWGMLSVTFFWWILSNSFKASVLIALILIIKFLLKDKISARIHYLLWLVVILRLVLPWSPESSFSLYNLLQDENGKLPTFSQMSIDKPLPLLQNKIVTEKTTSIVPIPNADISGDFQGNEIDKEKQIPMSWTTEKGLIAGWLMGVFALTILSIVRSRAFAKSLEAKLIAEESVIKAFNDIKSKLKVRSKIPLVETTKVTSPSLFGVLKPILLLPLQVRDKLTVEQLRYVFAHELGHFKRKDIIVNWAIHVLVILHWFNPLIWYASHKIREDQELACDAYSLSYLGTDESNDYGYTLITLLDSYSKTNGYASLANITGSKAQIKRRITMLTRMGKVSVKWSLLGSTIFLALGIITLTSAKANGSRGLEGINSQKSTDQIQIKQQLSKAPYDIEISKVEFHLGTVPNQKYAEVYLTVFNPAGRDQEFLPKGTIAAFVGTSGKVYKILTKDPTKHIDYSFDVTYKNTEDSRKEIAKKQGQKFEPGLLLLAPGVLVDLDESNIKAVIYEDENGSTVNIPIVGITPIITSPKTQSAAPNGNTKTVLIENFLKDHGYTVTTTTGGGNLAGASIQLPKSFDSVVNGVKIGELLRQKNEMSKKQDLDFSKYLGQKVFIFTWGLEGNANYPNGRNAFFLIQDDQIVGVWFESNSGSGEKNTTLSILENTL